MARCRCWHGTSQHGTRRGLRKQWRGAAQYGVARYGARGVARIEACSSGSAAMVEGVEQVPSQDKLDPCCSARRGDEPSRRVVGKG